jgi:hypothetical protein
MFRLGAIFAAVAMTGCGASDKPHATTSPASPPAHATATSTPERTQVSDTPPPPPPLTKPAGGDGTRAQGAGNHCDTLPVSEISVDGIMDDWREARAVTRVGVAPDGRIEMRCAWDGEAFAFLFDVKDDRVVRVKGGSEDRVTLSLAADGKPVSVTVFPANAMAKAKITKPGNVEAADSLQPNGFSVEVVIPAAAIAGFSPATPALSLTATFFDSDAATGSDTTPLEIKQPIELPDRKDLLDDFLATVRLKRTDIKLDTLVELELERKGKERLVAGGTVIGVITDQFAYVTLPAQSAADIKKIELLPLGPKGQQVVSAVVRQTGNGGSRDLLMLWTVWSGQLQPLVTIEIRKEVDGNVLESSYALVPAKGKKPAELVVTPRPAVGFTAETWSEVPAGDSDSILVPWDTKKAGIAYSLKGAEIERRDLPVPKKKTR